MLSEDECGTMNDERAPRVAKPDSPVPGRAAVFVDRDGTISEEVGYVNHLDRLRLYPWTAEAIRKLNQAGLPAIVVTNQSGVGRGYFPEELVHRVHERLAQELAAHGARLDAFYYCPHHPSARLEAYRKECCCRKPATGMVDEAVRRLQIDLRSSYVVGDSTRDMELGFNARARTILVMTGYGRGNLEYQRSSWPRMPDLIAESLLEAVEKILDERSGFGTSGSRSSGKPTPTPEAAQRRPL